MYRKFVPNRRLFRDSLAFSTKASQSVTSLEYANNRDYQFLQESPVPSDKFQASLLKLPIPKLEDTCKRYLLSQRPLIEDDAEFAALEAKVEEFKSKDGARLDAELRSRDKAEKDNSYVNTPWTEMYLKDRSSVALTHNPGLLFPSDPSCPDGASRAASLLVSALRFDKSLKSRLLLPEVYHMTPAKTNNDAFWRHRVKYMPNFIASPLAFLFKVFPLDMSQYGNIFRSTRIPQPGKDLIQSYPDDGNSRHILVMRKGRFFAFDVYDENGNIFSPAYYLEAIKQIVETDLRKVANSGVGTLTSANRDLWTEQRTKLRDLSERNRRSLDLIDSAIFAISLDDQWSMKECGEDETVRNIVGAFDPSNRWFDKSFSLFVSTDGEAAINFEHAWGDGVGVLRMINEIVEDSRDKVYLKNAPSTNIDINVTTIEFDLDAGIKETIKKADATFKAALGNVEFTSLAFEGLGKRQCKAKGLGPDSVMQSAFQIAYQRQFDGKVPATYESCSTAAYKKGRTECVRSCTVETKAVARAFNSSTRVSKEEKLRLLQETSKKHNELTKNGAMGQGWDRHLFAMRDLSSNILQEPALPELFLDPHYANINKNVLSTSTLSTDNVVRGGFCPVVPNGFGLPYMISKDQCGASVSAYKDQNSATQFADTLKTVLEELRQTLD